MFTGGGRRARWSRLATPLIAAATVLLVSLAASSAATASTLPASTPPVSTQSPSTLPAPTASSEPTVVADIPYGTVDEPALVLDAYPSSAGVPGPVVLAIHGGGWTGGDKATFTPLSRGLATAGFVVFNVNYSLDPDLGPAYPREVDDVTTALRWVQQHAAEYGGDPGRIGVVGGSAGAHLAGMLGTTADTAAEQPVRAVVSLSGPMDLPALGNDLRILEEDLEACAGATCPATPGPTPTSPDGLRVLLGCDPVDCPAEVLDAASPITYVTQYSPPFFLANSDDESVPVDQATRMADALRAQGVQVKVQIVPGTAHSIAYLPEVAQPVLTFLRTHLTAVPTPTTPTTPTVTTTAPTTPPVAPPAAPERSHWIRWSLLGLVALLIVAVAIRRTRGAPV